MQKQRFSEACEKVINIERAKGGIGTLGEKTLHAILKHYLEPVTENHEIRIGTFVADIANEDGVIEIQTANFNKLRTKLERFLGGDDGYHCLPHCKRKMAHLAGRLHGRMHEKT